MTRQILLRPTSSMDVRRTPLLDSQDLISRGTTTRLKSRGGNKRFAEVAGGTTAECAAVCCCCPCGLVYLLVLAVYKVPAGLCRKALRRKRRRALMKKGLLQPRNCGCDETDLQIHPISSPISVINSHESDKDVLALENEMWDKFYSAGFWRSPSQRSDRP